MTDTFLKGISTHLELPYLESVHHVSEWVFTMSPVHTDRRGGCVIKRMVRSIQIRADGVVVQETVS